MRYQQLIVIVGLPKINLYELVNLHAVKFNVLKNKLLRTKMTFKTIVTTRRSTIFSIKPSN